MLFNSWEFLVFFVTVCALYYSLATRAQNLLLLIASYFFYSWWDWRFSSLLLISTVVDYSVVRWMEHASARWRKCLLLVSLCTNLGILGFFKYFNFFADSAASLLDCFGLPFHPFTLQVVLPVGISFYTFQTMAYTIDVYRRRLRAERDPIVFGLYVAFFPQLVAGPIERAQHLLPQFRSARRVSQKQLASGAVLILIGLVRKVAIADVAASRVDEIFASPASMSTASLLTGAILFAVQIYCDFAGYSDIARGCSRMLGIDLMANFNHPYLSTNITEFWRRWHISLSTWLRDYLYIPLGGNRSSRWLTYRNIIVTMVLGGLWHGAAWTFVAWGGLHGMALVLHKIWLRGRRVPEQPQVNTWTDLLRVAGAWIVTMSLVIAAWIFFRSPDLTTAYQFFCGVFAFQGGLHGSGFQLLVKLVLIVLLVDVPQYVKRNHTVILSWPWTSRGVVYAGAVLLILFARTTDNAPFIYFQF